MKKGLLKSVSVFLSANILLQAVFPTAAYALTGGPSQPEVQSFEPVGTTEMVDLFSGDFTYNIPLLDVEGYPINIAYHSGVTMDQEASFVGLGWNINPGVINRNMRGVPDDFNGDEITKETFVKDNYTFGVNFGPGLEFFGFGLGFNLNYSMGVFYNNYKGIGYESGLTPAISAGGKFKLRSSLSISSNSQSGLSITPSVGLSFSTVDNESAMGTKGFGVSASVATTYNSRSGMKTMTFSKDMSFVKKNNKGYDNENSDGKGIYSTSASNGGSSISFANQSYVPQIAMEMGGANISIRATFGSELMGAHLNAFIGGYFSSQFVKSVTQTKKSYGYLYSQESAIKDAPDDVLHDINREKDAGYSKNSPALAITNYSYDVYSVSGQGIGGMYRPHRSDVGHVHDDKMESTAKGGSGGAEFGMGNGVKWGFDVKYNWSKSQTNRWVDDNNLLSSLGWSYQENEDPMTEPVYFKNAGEKTEIESDFIAYKNLNKAVRPAFSLVGPTLNLTEATAPDKLIASGGSEYDASSHVAITGSDHKSRLHRDKRSQPISYLTVAEKMGCLQSDMSNYEINGSTVTSVPRNSANRKDGHITEITALNNQGTRYVYGIAAYNNSQKEVSFTVKKAIDNAERTARCSTGLVNYYQSYVSGKHGENATSEYDEYFSSTTLPAYAHSYLLTAILSPDYVDVTQDGFTEDDLGTYTKINYSKLANDYKWRTPSPNVPTGALPKANYSEGNKTDPFDDKGTYIYGEKETWYVHSIETQNYIAKFELEDRNDGLGVDGEHGEDMDAGNRLKRLKSIKLYTKTDLNTPVKSVYFEYDYALCPGIPNQASGSAGKLTLKKIYFTYGNSEKGKMNKYEFTYNEITNNPGYDIKAYDRWGNYKPNSSCTTEGVSIGLSNADYPYVDQRESSPGKYFADDYAEAWCLKEIKLPSGGKIKIDYESDDYAYVQNKRAMQMFKVAGFGTQGGSPQGMLYGNSSEQYDVVFVDLNKPCPDLATFQRDYLPEQTNDGDGTRYLYFNLLVNLQNEGAGKYEYVRGYAVIADGDNCGLLNSGNRAWIKVNKVKVDDKKKARDVSPFAKAAWQFARLHTPYLVYPGSDKKKNKNDDPLGVLRMLIGFVPELITLYNGFNNELLEDGYAKQVNLTSSWVRLECPLAGKKGGGARVKKIEMEDGWSTLAPGQALSSYGQTYEYTTTEGEGKNARTISSGVAAYEPLIGGDENSWKQPVMYDKDNALIPDDAFYSEEPFGESFFPGPSIGYSKVTVSNLKRTNVTRHATGKVINEFYTTKDFPTITDRTDIQNVKVEPDWISGIFCLKVRNRVTVLQGFQIELNDMNGKPKAQWVYAESINGEEAKRISGMQYFYKTDAGNASHLNNDVKVVRPDGTVATTTIGVDVDMTLDTRQEESESQSAGAQANSDLVLFPPFVILHIPVVLPSYSGEQTRFRSAVITRIVNRYGILEKTIAYQDNSIITTSNEAFDPETGEVLLTKTQNEYNNDAVANDNIYNMTYPAHWTYDGMGMAYKNLGAEIDATLAYGCVISPANIGSILKAGDEVLVIPEDHVENPTDKKCWVEYYPDADLFVLLDKNYRTNTAEPSFYGTNVKCKIKILRSGRRNMHSVPVQQITSQRPVFNVAGTSLSPVVGNGVLNTSASIFDDKWPKECIINPYSDKQLICSVIDYAQVTSVVEAVNYLLNTNQLDWKNAGPSYSPTDISINRSLSSSYAYNGSVIAQKRDDHPGTDLHNFTMYRTQNGVDYANFGSILNHHLGYSGLTINVTFPMNSCSTSGGGSTSYSLNTGQFYIDVYPQNRQAFFDEYKFIRVKLINIIDYSYASGTCFCVLQFFYQDRTNPSAPEKSFVIYSNIALAKCYDNTKTFNANGCIIEQNKVDRNHPYLSGEKGIWRKKKDYLYLTNRVQADGSQNIRKDGIFQAYSPFWKYDNTSHNWLTDENNWVWTSEVSIYHPKGQEVENRDKLDRYSSALYNYKNQPVAVANNAQRREIGFDGFESYNEPYNALAPCAAYHWNFKNSTSFANYNIDATVSHTGMNSLLLTGSQSATNKYLTNNCAEGVTDEDCIPCKECILPFNPFRNKKYVVSGWVKVKPGTKVNEIAHLDDLKARVVITFTGGTPPDPMTIVPDGKIIDGWQRFDTVVPIPASCNTISVTLNASTLTDGAGVNTWYDDIRIHPFNGNMKTFVYDPLTLKLMAELDENNYATFYEYDLEGSLTRVKRETENGILTVKESRSHLTK